MYRFMCLTTLLVYLISIVGGKLPDLGTLCPYNDFCTTKATKTLKPNETGLMPCCQKCSCGEDCQLFGNCCPDKDLKPEVQVKYPCVSVDLYYNQPRRIRVFTYTDLFYHVIDDCPSISLSNEYPRCSDPLDLEDYVFVSDRQTGRVYKNKDCAKCNGVKQYKEWQMATNCPHKSEGLTREEWFSYVLTWCTITPILYDDGISQAFRCYPIISRIGKCNFTGTWKETDLEIKDACELDNPQTNDIYYHEFYVHTPVRRLYRDIYQNAYCKLCNPLDAQEWSDLCLDMLSVGDGSKATSSLEMFVVINLLRAKESSPAPQCTQWQIWDPFQEACMSVMCPVSSFFQAGKCEEMYKRLPRASYDIFFRIESHRNYFSFEVLKNSHNIIAGLINNRYCYQCSSQFVSEYKEPDVYYVRYAVKATKWCSESFLIEQTKMLEKTPYSFYDSILISNITLVPDLSVKQLGLKEHGISYFVNACPQGVHIDYILTDRCPRIPLAYTKLNVSNHSFKTERNGSLCVHEYFDIMRSIGNSTQIKDNFFIINILTIFALVQFVHTS